MENTFTENYNFAKSFNGKGIAKKWFHGGCEVGGANPKDFMGVRLQNGEYHHFDLNSPTFQTEITNFFSKK